MKVKLIGWEEGLLKLSLTLIQREYLMLSLKEAKSNVDRLLDNEVVLLNVKTEEIALEFIEKAKAIGVKCELIDY